MHATMMRQRHARQAQQRRLYFWTQRWDAAAAALLDTPSGQLHFEPANRSVSASRMREVAADDLEEDEGAAES